VTLTPPTRPTSRPSPAPCDRAGQPADTSGHFAVAGFGQRQHAVRRHSALTSSTFNLERRACRRGYEQHRRPSPTLAAGVAYFRVHRVESRSPSAALSPSTRFAITAVVDDVTPTSPHRRSDVPHRRVNHWSSVAGAALSAASGLGAAVAVNTIGDAARPLAPTRTRGLRPHSTTTPSKRRPPSTSRRLPTRTPAAASPASWRWRLRVGVSSAASPAAGLVARPTRSRDSDVGVRRTDDHDLALPPRPATGRQRLGSARLVPDRRERGSGVRRLPRLAALSVNTIIPTPSRPLRQRPPRPRQRPLKGGARRHRVERPSSATAIVAGAGAK